MNIYLKKFIYLIFYSYFKEYKLLLLFSILKVFFEVLIISSCTFVVLKNYGVTEVNLIYFEINKKYFLYFFIFFFIMVLISIYYLSLFTLSKKREFNLKLISIFKSNDKDIKNKDINLFARILYRLLDLPIFIFQFIFLIIILVYLNFIASIILLICMYIFFFYIIKISRRLLKNRIRKKISTVDFIENQYNPSIKYKWAMNILFGRENLSVVINNCKFILLLITILTLVLNFNGLSFLFIILGAFVTIRIVNIYASILSLTALVIENILIIKQIYKYKL